MNLISFRDRLWQIFAVEQRGKLEGGKFRVKGKVRDREERGKGEGREREGRAKRDQG
jgi:hypothetical protein